MESLLRPLLISSRSIGLRWCDSLLRWTWNLDGPWGDPSFRCVRTAVKSLSLFECYSPFSLSYSFSSFFSGGNGYINDYPTGRFLRDAKLYEIGAGTSEIRRMLIGRELFEENLWVQWWNYHSIHIIFICTYPLLVLLLRRRMLIGIEFLLILTKDKALMYLVLIDFFRSLVDLPVSCFFLCPYCPCPLYWRIAWGKGSICKPPMFSKLSKLK